MTRPTLPPLTEMLPLIEEMWRSRILSNNGPLHQRLEIALAQHLGVEQVSLVANATLGLMLALRQLGVSGEVITTPFSFVATGHAVRWLGAETVFADIDPVTLNLDPVEVERRVTSRTQAILAVHCYGTPCDTEGLAAVARRHGLRLIYDAAHAFGVREAGRSVLRAGDLSVLSFHATKVFNTFEGGAIISHDPETKQALARLRDFGIRDEVTVETLGFNAKMSEVHAALGLALLPRIDAAIEARRSVAQRYWDHLRGVEGIRCVCPPDRVGHNYYAYPILVEAGYPLSRDALQTRLKEHNIYARRYFYPLISDQPMYSGLPSAQPGQLPVARDAAARVLCLPLFPDLDAADQMQVIELIRQP